MWSRMFPGGGVRGKGYVWFSTTVKLILPLWRKPAKIKVHRNVTSAPPGEEESSEDSSQELCREKQPVLFIWMSVPWWVQTIFSALWDQNQNRIKQTKIPSPQTPEKQQEGMQEVLRDILIQVGRWTRRATWMHIQLRHLRRAFLSVPATDRRWGS